MDQPTRDRLYKAIVDSAVANNFAPENAVMDQFAIISSWTPMDLSERDRPTEYVILYNDDAIPMHCGLGLFAMGYHIIKNHNQEG